MIQKEVFVALRTDHKSEELITSESNHRASFIVALKKQFVPSSVIVALQELPDPSSVIVTLKKHRDPSSVILALSVSMCQRYVP